MVLTLDTTRAVRGIEPLRLLVQAVVEAEEHDESDAIEWKVTLDLTTKEGCFPVAKVILGMANRDPARSQAQFQGCGYAVVGAAPNNLRGVETVDPADLDNLIAPYVGGAKGPSWSPAFLEVEGKKVLVVTVEPPEVGDPLWPLRREYGNHHCGRIFVRRHGKTAPADDAEIDMLSARASSAPTQAPYLQVEAEGDIPMSWFDADRMVDEVEQWISEQQAELVAEARETDRRLNEPEDHGEEGESGLSHSFGPGVSAPLDAMATMRQIQQQQAALNRALAGAASLDWTTDPDARSLDEYIEEVDGWAERLREWAPDAIPDHYSEHGHGNLRISVTNLSKRFLSDVEVTVHFSLHHAQATNDEPSADSMPSPPRTYGKETKRPGILSTPLYPSIDYSIVPGAAETGFARRTWVEEGSVKVRFLLGDLRPLESDLSDDVWVFLPSRPSEGELQGEWAVTARDLHDVVRGTLTLAVDEEPTDLVECLSTDPDDLTEGDD